MRSKTSFIGTCGKVLVCLQVCVFSAFFSFCPMSGRKICTLHHPVRSVTSVSPKHAKA